MAKSKERSWWNIGRLVGHVDPLAAVRAPTHEEALAYAVAEFEVPPAEVVVSPVWVGHLPPQRVRRARRPRSDFKKRSPP